MSTNRARRARELFDLAHELDPSGRRSFLEEHCVSDDALRAEVESLIDAFDRAGSFLEPPSPQDTPQEVEEAPGSQAAPAGLGTIDGFRILRVLGEGGMGVVYEAQQEQPRRTVALKVIRSFSTAGLLVDRTLKLFQREVQTLARLEHPGIAAIYEAGCTDEGRHFFAMELVRGAPLDQYVETEKLSTRTRLRLFQRICAAIHYAHQRGVVHRDLKPSNILVDAEGNPKILDFGLAKITDSDVTMTTTVTEVGKIQGTLPYMSPEQARGAPDEINLLTDVYGLGVILYELLTGQLPYDVRQTMLPEALRVICEATPRRPSAVNRTLRGDVETIALKALEKEPARRYQSAAALAEDVERYLTNQPVLARPPTTIYQLRKLIARHKAPFAFLASLFAVVTGVAIWMSVLYHQADRHRRLAEANLLRAEDAEREARTAAGQAEQINRFLQDIISSVAPEKARGRDVTVLRELLEEAARRADTGLRSQPEVAAAVADTIGNAYRGLGLYDEAEPHLRTALALRQRVFGDEHEQVAESLNNLAVLLKAKGDLGAAEPLYRRALAINRHAFLGDHPRIAIDLNNLAAVLKGQGRYEEAEPLYRDALDMTCRLYGNEHEDVARGLHNLAGLLKAKGDYEEATSLCRQALAINRRVLGGDHPRVADNLVSLALLLQDMGDYAAAEPLGTEALEIQRKVLGDDHPHLARSLNTLAGVLRAKGDLDAAEAYARKALTMRRERLGSEHPAVAASLNSLAILLKEKGDYAAAEPLYREALAIRRRLLGDEHPETLASMNNLALLLQAQNKLSEAEALSDQALETAGKVFPQDHWRQAVFQAGYGLCLTKLQRYEEAERHLLDGYAGLKLGLGQEHEQTRDVLVSLVDLYEAWGQTAKAAEYRAILPDPPDTESTTAP